jgi:hypothetical protein
MQPISDLRPGFGPEIAYYLHALDEVLIVLSRPQARQPAAHPLSKNKIYENHCIVRYAKRFAGNVGARTWVSRLSIILEYNRLAAV